MEGHSEEPALPPAPSRAPDPPLPAPKRATGATARRLGLPPPPNQAAVRRASRPNPAGGASMGEEEGSPVHKGRKRPPQHPTSRSGAVKPKKPAAQRVPSVEVDLSSPRSIESPSSSSRVALNPTPSTSPTFPVDCEHQLLDEMPTRLRATEIEERRTLAEERRAAAEERRVVAEEMAKRAEHEQRIMFMDPSKLDEKGRAYLELMRDGVLAAAARAAQGFNMDGFGGFGGNGSSSANGGVDGSDH